MKQDAIYRIKRYQKTDKINVKKLPGINILAVKKEQN